MGRVNLFVIGVNKAGTSWLYHLLSKHPDIYMSDVKELFFFGTDREGPTNLEAYHRHFDFNGSHSYYGEATATYYREPAVATEIASYNSSAKLIAIVRDPIERTRSHFQYHKQLGIIDEEQPLQTIFERDPSPYLANSHYETALPAFRRQFGRDQFSVVSLEESKANPEAFWSDLLAFLDLSSVPCPDPDAEPENPTGSASFRWVYRTIMQPIKHHVPSFYKWMLQSTAVRQTKLGLLRLLGQAEKEPIPQNVKERLRQEFAPTYAYLSDLGFESYDPN